MERERERERQTERQTDKQTVRDKYGMRKSDRDKQPKTCA